MSSPLMHQGFGSNDLDDIISPLEAGLGWSDRRYIWHRGLQ